MGFNMPLNASRKAFDSTWRGAPCRDTRPAVTQRNLQECGYKQLAETSKTLGQGRCGRITESMQKEEHSPCSRTSGASRTSVLTPSARCRGPYAEAERGGSRPLSRADRERFKGDDRSDRERLRDENKFMRDRAKEAAKWAALHPTDDLEVRTLRLAGDGPGLQPVQSLSPSRACMLSHCIDPSSRAMTASP